MSRYRSPKEQDGEVLSIAADAEVLTTKGKKHFLLFLFFGMNGNGRMDGRERILVSLRDRQMDGQMGGLLDRPSGVYILVGNGYLFPPPSEICIFPP
jgi:hypothetical protein